MTTEVQLHSAELNSMETILSKARSAPADVVEVRKTLLKIVDEENPPPLRNRDTRNTASCSQGAAPRVWWSGVKRVFRSFKHETKTAPHEFEIHADDLTVREKIGQGLHCDVFEAKFKPARRQVAVKQLHSGFDPAIASNEKTQRMMKDLRFLSCSLRHPAIVEFIGVSLAKEECAVNLVFEFMGGGTLEDFFDARWDSGDLSSIPLSQALGWGKQMFSGLRFLHERDPPIIHRDLKPSNLLLSADLKMLKMQDFGVSKTADMGIMILGKKRRTGDEKSVVQTDLARLSGPSLKGFSGTARYMAPEIETKSKTAEPNYTTKADVYSGALLLWLLLEGERPWERHHGHVAHALAQTGRRPPLRTDNLHYPAALATLMAACWAHNPCLRPSAAFVEEALAAAEAGVPCSASTTHRR